MEYYLNEFRYVGQNGYHYVVQRAKKGMPTVREVETVAEADPPQIDEWAYLYWGDGKPKEEIISWE